MSELPARTELTEASDPGMATASAEALTSTASPNSDPDSLSAALRRELDGPRQSVREHCRNLDHALLAPPETPLSMAQHRERVTRQLAALAGESFVADGFPENQGGGGLYADAVTAFEMLGHTDLSLFVKAGVQWGLFGGAVSLLGTERHDALMPRIISGELQGCFAMSETGHGSDVQGLLTTATYDAETDEIVVHSPTSLARKDYIGNAAVDGRVAAVFAQLLVGGDQHGVHCVLVPIRGDDGGPAAGVTITDCGAKLGLPGVDNGRLMFDRVRVPRTNLLGRYGDIDDHGVYSSPIENPSRRFFTMLGTLVRGRISVAGGAGAAARSALTVATRYGSVRRQFARPGASDGGDGAEMALLDYRTHQRRLMPRIATAYALQFAQNGLVTAMDDVLAGRATGEVSQRELEARAAGIKAITTRHATDTIQECREACGGAGYLWANRLPALKNDTDIFTTFEGDNTVLLQLVAKSLLAQYKSTFGDLDTLGIVKFGARMTAATFVERAAARGLLQRIVDIAPGREEDVVFATRTTQLALIAERESHLLDGLARRLRRAEDPTTDAYEVFNDTQDHLVATAMAHVERTVAESFATAVATCADADAAPVLSRVCDLFMLTTIEKHKAWYLEHDRLTPARTKTLTALVNQACAELREVALPLVDAFGIPEAWLTTEMLDDVRG